MNGDSIRSEENFSIEKITIIDENTQANRNNKQDAATKLSAFDNNTQSGIKRYRHTHKPRKSLSTRTWRTRKDPFDNVSSKICIQLELNPEKTAKSLLAELIAENPDQYNSRLLRTLQRRVANWRMQQIKSNQENRIKNILRPHDSMTTYVSLVAHAIING